MVSHKISIMYNDIIYILPIPKIKKCNVVKEVKVLSIFYVVKVLYIFYAVKVLYIFYVMKKPLLGFFRETNPK